MTPPTISLVAQRAYDLLGPVVQRDSAEDGWLYRALVAGLVAGDEVMWQLVEDPGLAVYLAPDVAPTEWLAWLATINGARLHPGMTVAQERAEIINPTGWRRGLPASLLETVAPFLVAGAHPRLRQRNSPSLTGDQPAHVTLEVHTADLVGTEDDLTAAFLAAVPLGFFGHVIFTDGLTYDDLATDYATYTALAAAFGSYDDIAT